MPSPQYPIPPITQSPIYRTGDLAKWMTDGNIEFLGRIDHQVKIRGFRVEPGEIASRLLNHEHIRETVVIVKQNEEEKYLCAYFVSKKKLSTRELREYLSANLPDYMIPSYFVSLDSIPLTFNGKVDRKALPEPGIDIGTEYIAPRNQTEQQLVALWSEVLTIDPGTIGIDHDFFELGGHSLNAVVLVDKINEVLNVMVPVTILFKQRTVRDLSQYINKAREEKYVSIQKAEKKEYYPLSSTQRRLYFLDQVNPESLFYNISVGGIIRGEINKDRLKEIFRQLVHRHESFRTSFELVDEEIVQKVHDHAHFELEYYDLSDRQQTGNENTGGNQISTRPEARIITGFMKPFDLSRPPLIRSGLIKLKKNHLLIADIHHIISDGMSVLNLRREFLALLQEQQLPALNLQYRDYAQWVNSPAQQERIKKQGAYWSKQFEGEIPVLNLPFDYPRPLEIDFEGDVIRFEIEEEEMQQLSTLASAENVTSYVVMLAAFYILLSKLSSQENITIGTPVIGRRHADLLKIIGMFANTLALKNYPTGEKTFNKFLKEVGESTLLAFDNQEFHFDDLVEQLNIPRAVNRNPLFDVMMAFQHNEPIMAENLKLKRSNLKEQEYYRGNRTSKFDWTFHCRNVSDGFLLKFEYRSQLFKRETMERFVNYYNRIISIILEEPQQKISDIEILSTPEKKQILLDFNQTRAEYPRNMTIHKLFEIRVEQTPDHAALIGENPKSEIRNPKQEVPSGQINSLASVQLSYRHLNQRSNQLANVFRRKGVRPDTVVGLMVERSIEMIIGLLAILKAGGAYLPIDSVYPPERKKYMLEDSRVKLLLTNHQEETLPAHIPKEIEIINIMNENGYEGESINPQHVNNSKDLVYVIYTSGSTGNPKGVMLEHQNVVNLIIYTNQDTNIDSSRVLQFSTISFDASFHEIFSALLPGGSLYLIKKETQTNFEALFEIIEKNQIKTLFLPISLLRTIFRDKDNIRCFPTCVRHIQTAGDRVIIDENFREYLKANKVFLHNHYGPSETHVVTALTLDPKQELPEFPTIGKPIANTSIYILDKGNHLTPVGVPGELCVAGIQVGRGYLDRPELTAEKFLYRSYKSYMSYIYQTGDLAKWTADGNIQFLGRIDHQVKIRGFRVEPGEIASRLLNHEHIREAVVTVKQNDEEKYLCAYFVSEKELSVLTLREYLSGTLPDYMLPSYFVRVDAIPLKPNGKINISLLPEPGIKVGENYVAPRHVIEEKLAAIWSEILDIEKNVISIDANFFQLGGHSLKATISIAKIHKVMEVKLPLAQLFKTPTIRGLAEYIKKRAKDRYLSIQPCEKKEYYALSSAQKRLYILQQLEPESTGYNLPRTLPLKNKIDKEKLSGTFRKLISRHESLRTSFHMGGTEPVQRIHETVDFDIEYYVVPFGQDLNASGEQIQAETATHHSFIRPFDLSHAPLIRVELIELEEERYGFLFDMHHIITDGTSQDILGKEFLSLYAGEEFAPLRLQYKDFSQWQNSPEQQNLIKSQETYWLDLFSHELPVLNLPTDYPRPVMQSFAGAHINFVLNNEETKTIKEIAGKYALTLYMSILAIFTILLAKLSGQEDIIVGTPIAARRHADLERIVGMFVNTLAMRNYPLGEKTLKEFLKEVKKNTLETYENQEYQFEDLVEKISVRRDTSRNPVFDTVFNLSNFTEFKYHLSRQKQANSNKHIKGTSKFDLNLAAIDYEEKLHFRLEYCTKLFKSKTIDRFIGYFKTILSSLSFTKDRDLADIQIISQEEKRRVLLELDNLNVQYPEDKTIHRLFAEQANNIPDHIAVSGQTLHQLHLQITYNELNEKSNHLAYLLREKGVQADTIVAIMPERSIEMIIGILGILKAGGAYMPIDPEYPEERIQYMLADSGAKILVTDPVLSGKFEKLLIVNCQLLMVNEMTNKRQRLNNPPKQASFHLHLSPAPATCLAYIIYTSGTTGKPKGTLIEHGNVVRLLFNNQFQFDFSSTDVWTLFHSFCFDFSVWEMYGALLYGGKLLLIPGKTSRNPYEFREILKRETVTVLNLTPTAFYSLANIETGIPAKDLNIKYMIFGGEALAPIKLKKWQKKYPGTKSINMYGITETTVHVTYKQIEDSDIRLNISNIGKPIPTLSAIIMDKNRNLVPIGTAGELFVAGEGVGRGYLNRPELTAERFLFGPYSFYKSYRSYLSYISHRSHIYKTGDLVRVLENRDMEYLGRIDQQVKIRGFRIELEEIEYRLLKHHNIKEAIVLPIEQKGRDKYLNAYIVATGELAASELRKYLSLQLPDYMIPSYFIPIDAVPLTTTGKIDRKALTSISAALTAGERFLPPKSNLEKTIAAAWSKILQIDTIGIHNNYFDMGGNSINILTLSLELEKLLKRHIHVAKLFRYPTIASFARHLEMEKESESQITVTAEKQSADVKNRLKKRRNRDGSSRHHSH